MEPNFKKLRVGLLLNSFQVSSWQKTLLQRILDLDCARIELVIINRDRKPALNFNTALYSAYIKVDRKLSGAQFDHYADLDVSRLLGDVTCLQMSAEQKGHIDYFRPDDVEKIRSYDLDVIIRMGFRILRGDILDTAKLGIWSYHHCDNNQIIGNPPGFYEVAYDWVTTGCILQILTKDLDNGLVIYRSWALTHPYSVDLNRSQNFWKSASFIPRKLKEAYRLGPDEFLKKARLENEAPALYSNPLFKNPRNGEMLRLLPKLLWKHCKRLIRNLIFKDQWILMYSRSNSLSHSFCKFKKMTPPADRFWADPFVITKNNKHYIYLEDADLKTGVGIISLIEMDQKGNYTSAKPIIERDYHLSYPFVFELDERLYIIPDTHFNNTIEIYECVSFPDKWEFKMNIMENVRAVDVTPLYHKGKWWLFMNIVENEGSSYNDELFLFYSDDLFTTNWSPHPLNPIISDIRRARPAGAIFERGNSLYRPSQNPSGFNINRILTLSEKDYREEIVSIVKPNWEQRCVRTHTFNQSDGITIIDAQMRRFRNFS